MIFFLGIYFDYYPYALNYSMPIISRNEVFLPTQTAGILKFNLRYKEYKNFNKYSNLSSNYVKMIEITEDEETIIVLTDKKIDFIQRNGTFIRSFSLFFPVFPDTTANCIYLNGRYIFVGFKNGVSYFSIDEYPYGTNTVRYFFNVKDIIRYKENYYLATDSAIYRTSNFKDTIKIYSGNFNKFKIIQDTLYSFGPSGLLVVNNLNKIFSGYVTDIFISYSKSGRRFFISTTSNIREFVNNQWVIKVSGNFQGVLLYNDSLFGINKTYGIGLIESLSIRYFHPPLPGYVPAGDFVEKDDCIYTVFGSNIGGTFSEGLRLISKFSNGEWVTYNYKNELSLPIRVTSIELDRKKRIWIGIWSGATYKTIYNWNGDTSKPVLIMPPESTVAVTEILYGPGDTIWIGGHLNYIFKGYVGRDSFEWTVYKVQNIVWPKSIVYDKNGTIYFGTASHNYENGVFYKEGENFYRINHSFGDIIYSMASDRDGNVWVGTEKGLFKIVNKNVVKEYLIENSDFYPGPFAGIAFSKDNKIWVLQNGYGVLYLDKHNVWVKVKELEGLRTEEGVNCMFVDSKNNLWIGTYQGLFRINLNQLDEENVKKTIAYPNPIKYGINRKLTIKGLNIKGGNIKIFNSSGFCVLQKYIDADSIIIETSYLDKPGNYVYVIEKDKIKLTGSFFVLR